MTFLRTGKAEREGYANVTSFKLISPAHFVGTIFRIDPALRFVSRDRATLGRLVMGPLELGAGASTSAMSELMANLPFARVIRCGMHIWKLVVAIRQAQKTPITWPGSTVPSRTSFAPNQKPCTNIPYATNWLKPEVHAQIRLTRHAVFCSFCMTATNAECSCETALNAFTVAIADTARSTRVAACPNCARSTLRRGPAKRCEIICRTTMAGTTERITRVRDHDPRNPRMTQVMQVVMC